MSKEHVDAQQARISNVIRVRPSDIASAAHLVHQEQEEPLSFKQVAPLALAMLHASAASIYSYRGK